MFWRISFANQIHNLFYFAIHLCLADTTLNDLRSNWFRDLAQSERYSDAFIKT